jgi:hypothetical protein
MAKHILKEQVRTRDHKIFAVQKAAASEQDILLHFGREVKYQVVKLDVRDLPSKDEDGRKITWINNFGVRDASGKYARNVRYKVFLRRPRKKDAAFFTYDHRGLHQIKTPMYEGSKPPRSGMVQVDFNTGDPGIGCK